MERALPNKYVTSLVIPFCKSEGLGAALTAKNLLSILFHFFNRKIEIVTFASRTRQLFIRLLALVKWANSASKVDKCGVRY